MTFYSVNISFASTWMASRGAFLTLTRLHTDINNADNVAGQMEIISTLSRTPKIRLPPVKKQDERKKLVIYNT